MPKIGPFTAELKALRLNLKRFCIMTGINYETAKDWNRHNKEIPLSIRSWLDQRAMLVDFAKEILKTHNSLERKAIGQVGCQCNLCKQSRKILYPKTHSNNI